MITNRKSVVAKFKSNFTLWPYEWVKESVGAFIKNNQETCLINATHLNAFTSFSEMSKYFTNCSTDINHSYNSYKKSNKMHQCITIYFIFIKSSTCFGRHTAHHQEPKTALAASGFACMEGCWTCSCWTLTASSNYTSSNLPRMQNQRLLVQF